MVMSRDQNAGRSQSVKIDDGMYLCKGETVQIFGNNRKESKFNSGRNKVQIAVRECL